MCSLPMSWHVKGRQKELHKTTERQAGRQADDGLDHQLDLVSFACHTIIIHTWDDS